MYATTTKCVNCLNKFVSKAGQCEVCGIPEIKILKNEDLLPLQFLNYAVRTMSLENVILLANLGSVKIEIHSKDLSKSALEELMDSFKAPVLRYVELAKEQAEGGNKSQSSIGLSLESGESDNKKKLDQFRAVFFNSIVTAVEATRLELQFLQNELEFLFPFLILKEEVVRQHEVLILECIFKYIISTEYREEIQNHLNINSKKIIKAAESKDERSMLNAISLYANFSEIRNLATTVLFLTFGDNMNDYLNLLGFFKISAHQGNPNGFFMTQADNFFLEQILQNLNWKSFRQDWKSEKPKPVRQRLHRECLAATLQNLKTKESHILPWVALALKEQGAEISTEIVENFEQRSASDQDFYMTRLLIERPFASEKIKELIHENPEKFKNIFWTVGLKTGFIELPSIEKTHFDTHDEIVLREATRQCLKKVKTEQILLLNEKTLEHIKRHAITNEINRPEWEESKLDEDIKNDLLNLLIFHETDHHVICQALKLLTSTPTTYWLRKGKQLDNELYQALTFKNKSNYRMPAFLEEVNAVKPLNIEEHTITEEDNFIFLAYEWLLENKLNNLHYFYEFLSYLAENFQFHKSVRLLDSCFVLWLRIKKEDQTYSAPPVLEKLIALAQKRKLLDGGSKTIAISLEEQSPLWKQGLIELLKHQIYNKSRDEEIVSLDQFLKSENLLSALLKVTGDEEYVNFILELIGNPNLNNTQLFKTFFETITPVIKKNPQPAWLQNLKYRVHSVRHIDNPEIDSLILNFLNQFESQNKSPDSKVEELLKEEKAEVSIDSSMIREQIFNEMNEKIEMNFKKEIAVITDELKEKSVKLSLKLSADISSPEGLAKINELQVEFQKNIQALQDETERKIKDLTNAYELTKKLIM
jgi:hypothetical protein